jgi:hypothetical protein
MKNFIPPVIPAVSDARFGGKWTSIDAEVLRLVSLGSKNVKSFKSQVTISAGSTVSNKINVYTSDANYIVIKSINVSLSGKLHLFIDDLDNVIEITTANALFDLEAVFGTKIYGSKVDVQFEVESAVESDTDVTIIINGFETAGKVQTPT